MNRPSSAAVLLLLAVLACDASEPRPRASSIDFASLPDTLGVGDVATLTARPLGARGEEIADATLSWTSRTPATLAIVGGTTMRALAAGDAWLIATVRGSARGADSVRVHVVPTSRSLQVAFARDSVTVFETLTAAVSVDARYGPALDASLLRFASSDTLIARVDSLTGSVRLHGDGDVIISATDGERTATTALRSYLRTLETGGVRLRQIAIGWGFGCGLDAGGAAYCWGANNYGQLGRGTRFTGSEMLPFGPVSTSTRFDAIAAGRGGACGMTQAGGVECWGTRTLAGLAQQLTLDQRTVPVAVTFPPGTGRIVRIDVGTRGPLCAIDEAGANYCFGDNLYNGIGGSGSPVTAPRPVPGSPASGMQSMDTGELHGCGSTTTGALWCWGDGQAWAGARSNDATRVEGVPSFRDVVAGYQSTCALAADGTPWCAGLLEQNTISSWRALATLPGAAPLVRLEGGTDYVCGLTANGDASCFSNERPLIAPYESYLPQPVPLSRRERFVDVGAGMSGMCGVTAEGFVRCLTFLVRFQ